MLSPEVQAQADEIRRNRSLVKSLQAERDLWKSKAMDSQGKLDALSHKDEMSDEDRAEIKRQAAELDALNDELEGAAQDNVTADTGAQAGGVVAPTVLERDADASRADPMPGTGQNGTVPLMPNSAFDPDPTGSRGVGAGQPNQPKAIETPGGFVIAGGGGVSRAPGSDPASPSSSLVVPTDPDAKAAASNADVAKSGLGDSSQNALLGADGQPIADGPGIPREPTDADRERAQKQADLEADEKARREANPLNLAPAGTPQAGSVDAAKAADQGQRLNPDGSVPAPDGQPASGGTPEPTATPVPAPNVGPDGDPSQKPAA